MIIKINLLMQSMAKNNNGVFEILYIIINLFIYT